jgi:hypothetical protein
MNRPTVLISSTSDVIVFDTNTGTSKPFMRNVPEPNNYFFDVYEHRVKTNDIHWYPLTRHHYGICGNDSQIYISTDEFPSKILKVSRNGFVENCFEAPVHRTPPNRIHQMMMVKDQILAISPTSDAIFRYSTNHDAWEILPLHPGFALIPNWDQCHPNSINVVFGDTIIVCMQNTVNGKQSSLLKLDVDKFVLLKKFPLGMHVHNVFPFKDEICVLDSFGAIVSISGETVPITSNGYYLKGVGITNEHIVIGGIKTTKRENRPSSVGMLFLLTVDGEMLDQFSLTNGVNDLRVVNQIDHGNGGSIIGAQWEIKTII